MISLQVGSHLIAVRFDRLKLGRNDTAAHRDILVPVFHFAVDDAAGGCMELLCTCFLLDTGDVIFPELRIPA